MVFWLGGTTAVSEDGLDIVAGPCVAQRDGTLDTRHGMLGQELQDADVLAGTGRGAVAPLEVAAQLAEHGRQLPVAIDVGMVQRGRLAAQRHQIVQRIQHLHAVGVAARVLSDDLVAGHDGDAFDIALHGHGAESIRPRHAVAVAVETHGLVLVHLGRLRQARIEGALRQ